jgi:hypothetical protein
MKKLVFVVGFISGAIVVHKWRTVAKHSIKGGILAARKLKEISEQVKEDLEDVTAEATDEILKENEEHARR